MTYSIVRPTAFFKSLGGQVESVKNGGPFVMFGDGRLTACKPISEADLASFIADAVTDRDMANKILPIGGPGEAVTPLEQAAMIFRHARKKEKTLAVPLGLMDGIIGIFEFLEKLFPSLEVCRHHHAYFLGALLCRIQWSLPESAAIMRVRACWCGTQKSNNTALR